LKIYLGGDISGNEIASETLDDSLKIVGEVDSANDVTLTSDSVVQPNSHVPVKISITGLQDIYGNKINHYERVTLKEQSDTVIKQIEYSVNFDEGDASVTFDNIDLSTVNDGTYTFDVLVGDK